MLIKLFTMPCGTHISVAVPITFAPGHMLHPQMLNLMTGELKVIKPMEGLI